MRQHGVLIVLGLGLSLAVGTMAYAAQEASTESGPVETEKCLVQIDPTGTRGALDTFSLENTDVAVLFTNDVHGGVSADMEYSGSAASLGYAGLAGVKADAAASAGAVSLVDLGDAIFGAMITSETNGQAAIDLMHQVGYDILVPGNHEFDFGMNFFLDYAASEEAAFLACNFVDLRTGEAPLDGYTVLTYDIGGQELKVGYVGIITPETYATSTPTYFQDEEGNYIYGFMGDDTEALYSAVQAAVDGAYGEGADLVIAVTHLGDDGIAEGWSSIDVAANTAGISAFLDGHSHSVIPSQLIQNKDGEDVLLASAGTKLEHIGVLKISMGEDNTLTISTGLVDEVTQEEKETPEYEAVYANVQEMEDSLAYLLEVIGTTEFDLPLTREYASMKGVEAMPETNLGDFLADVFRIYFDTDVAVMNTGSIRASITEGDITYMDMVNVYPWNTPIAVVKVSGQVLLDMVEMGARMYPQGCGGWIQPSGMTYTVDATIPSSVVTNTDGEFVSVDGEYRVKDMKVGDEPLDLEKEYTLAISTYYCYDYGDGMTMFKGCETLVPAEGEEAEIDNDIMKAYLASIDKKVPEEYRDTAGEGRITIISGE